MHQIISLLWVIHVRIGVKCTIVMCLAQVSVCLVLKVFYVVNWSVLLNLKKKILTINLDFAQITIRVLRITLAVFYSRKPFIVVEYICTYCPTYGQSIDTWSGIVCFVYVLSWKQRTPSSRLVVFEMYKENPRKYDVKPLE